MSSATEFLLDPNNRRFLNNRENTPYSVRPRRHFWLVLAALTGALTGGLVTYFYFYFTPLWRLHAHGVETRAVVLNNESRHTDEGQQVGQITYRFSVKDGNGKRDFTRTYDFNMETDNNWRVGARIKVVYDPAHPEISRAGDELADTPEKESAAKILVGMTALLPLTCFVLWLTQQWLPLRRLRRHPGRVLTGEVTGCAGEDDDGVEHLIVSYRFVNPDGVSMEARSPPRFRADLDREHWPTTGTPVRVYYVNAREYYLL